MNLENSIKDVIGKKLAEGMVEKLIEEQLEKGINNALGSLFGSYGDLTKVIEEKVKSVMVPYLENYDYSNYITKLDSVMVDVLKNSALENKKLLSNFQELMIPAAEKEIKVTDLFDKWKEHVEQNVETDGLEVDYDDEPTYEYVDVRFEVVEDDDRDWSSFKYATLVFECDHDEKMNFAIRLSKWKSRKGEGWDMQFDNVPDLKSLRNLNSFELLLMKMNQDRTQIILDELDDSDSIVPEERPELSY
ncbi:hypothetical protein BK742_26140 [Bacillus thuringiensis serovar pingluonsis]|uniref:Uncharacterized protein n=1 Tax=Bacillus thuringiensis serovar pingluonsis TaxID=180881 RepID=A0A243AYV0_BACTU|nr:MULTISPECIES: hypothetical protein [Bacillus cereus group]MEB9684590.1 hypothetical protein [Bacillus anthracis]OTY35441.1 hypothetical protein BK742_26140 [Bacillus thuringiensis serovar pingluonsis]